jgi:hypothetical protein
MVPPADVADVFRLAGSLRQPWLSRRAKQATCLPITLTLAAARLDLSREAGEVFWRA